MFMSEPVLAVQSAVVGTERAGDSVAPDVPADAENVVINDQAQQVWGGSTIAWGWRCLQMRKQRDAARQSVREAVASREILQRDINKLLAMREKDAKLLQDLRERIEAEEANARELLFSLAVKTALVEKTREEGEAQAAAAVLAAEAKEQHLAATAVRHEKVIRFFLRAAHAKAAQRSRVENARTLMAYRIGQKTDTTIMGKALKDAEAETLRGWLEWKMVAHASAADIAAALRDGHRAGRAERSAEADAELAAATEARTLEVAELKRAHATEVEFRQKQSAVHLKQMREQWRDEWGREWARRGEEKALRAAAAVLVRCLKATGADMDDQSAECERAEHSSLALLRAQADEELGALRATMEEQARTAAQEQSELRSRLDEARALAALSAALLSAEVAAAESHADELSEQAGRLNAELEDAKEQLVLMEGELQALEEERQAEQASYARAHAPQRTGRHSAALDAPSSRPGSAAAAAAAAAGASVRGGAALARRAAGSLAELHPAEASPERNGGFGSGGGGGFDGGGSSGFGGGGRVGGACGSGSEADSPVRRARPTSTDAGGRASGRIARRYVKVADKAVGTGANEAATEEEAQAFLEAAAEAERRERGALAGGGPAALAGLFSSQRLEALLLHVSAALGVDTEALAALREAEQVDRAQEQARQQTSPTGKGALHAPGAPREALLRRAADAAEAELLAAARAAATSATLMRKARADAGKFRDAYRAEAETATRRGHLLVMAEARRAAEEAIWAVALPEAEEAATDAVSLLRGALDAGEATDALLLSTQHALSAEREARESAQAALLSARAEAAEVRSVAEQLRATMRARDLGFTRALADLNRELEEERAASARGREEAAAAAEAAEARAERLRRDAQFGQAELERLARALGIMQLHAHQQDKAQWQFLHDHRIAGAGRERIAARMAGTAAARPLSVSVHHLHAAGEKGGLRSRPASRGSPAARPPVDGASSGDFPKLARPPSAPAAMGHRSQAGSILGGANKPLVARGGHGAADIYELGHDDDEATLGMRHVHPPVGAAHLIARAWEEL